MPRELVRLEWMANLELAATILRPGMQTGMEFSACFCECFENVLQVFGVLCTF